MFAQNIAACTSRIISIYRWQRKTGVRVARKLGLGPRSAPAQNRAWLVSRRIDVSTTWLSTTLLVGDLEFRRVGRRRVVCNSACVKSPSNRPRGISRHYRHSWVRQIEFNSGLSAVARWDVANDRCRRRAQLTL